jgi:hypothetical protein
MPAFSVESIGVVPKARVRWRARAAWYYCRTCRRLSIVPFISQPSSFAAGSSTIPAARSPRSSTRSASPGSRLGRRRRSRPHSSGAQASTATSCTMSARRLDTPRRSSAPTRVSRPYSTLFVMRAGAVWRSASRGSFLSSSICASPDPALQRLYVVASHHRSRQEHLVRRPRVATLKGFVGSSDSRADYTLARVHRDAGPHELSDVLLIPFEKAALANGVDSIMNSYAEVDGMLVAADADYSRSYLARSRGSQARSPRTT